MARSSSVSRALRRSAQTRHLARLSRAQTTVPETTGRLRSERSRRRRRAPDPRFRGLVACCASAASSFAFASDSVADPPQLVENVELEIRRSDSSITALSDTPVRAARIFTRLRTSSSIVSVVLTLLICASWRHDATMQSLPRSAVRGADREPDYPAGPSCRQVGNSPGPHAPALKKGEICHRSTARSRAGRRSSSWPSARALGHRRADKCNRASRRFSDALFAENRGSRRRVQSHVLAYASSPSMVPVGRFSARLGRRPDWLAPTPVTPPWWPLSFATW
jgi:hypothetical protein